MSTNRMQIWAAIAVVSLGSLMSAPTLAADMRGVTATLDGTDTLRLVERTLDGGRFVRTVTTDSQDFSVTLTFGSDGTATGGSFAITGYEDFPVTGTWTSKSKRRVRLVVDQTSLAANLGPELINIFCTAPSCTTRVTWKPFIGILDLDAQTMRVVWRETTATIGSDKTFAKEFFTYKGSGPVTTGPAPDRASRSHRER